MDLDDQIRALSCVLGAEYYGVADLSPARVAIRSQGGENAAAYPRAVVFGMPLIGSLVDLLPACESIGANLYHHHAYETVNAMIDQVTLRIAGTLQETGYRALPVPASKRIGDGRACGVFSHKMAARLAGLGWIGKSCLLITPDRGPRVRWGSVLTNAPLQPTGIAIDPQCGSCTACIDICPAKAFTGAPFHEEDPLEARFDVAACERHFAEREAELGVMVCGLCLYICPHGKGERVGIGNRVEGQNSTG